MDGIPDDVSGLQYYLQDDLGSPIRLAEAGGDITQSYGYDEFGQDLYGNGGMIQPFGFTGYEPDAIAGTAFAQAREYVSGLGRFAGMDVISGFQDAPFTMNRYGYCWGNPTGLVDYDGKLPQCVKIGLKIVVAVVVVVGVVAAAPVVAGAIASAVAALGVSTTFSAGIATVATATLSGAVIAGTTSVTDQIIDKGIKNIDGKEVALNTATGAAKAGLFATAAVTGGAAGLGIKVAINTTVDCGRKVIEDRIQKNETTVVDLVKVAVESAATTTIFHRIDKLVGNLSDKLLRTVELNRYKVSGRITSIFRNLLKKNVDEAQIRDGILNLKGGFKDYYQYELSETLRRYFVQNITTHYIDIAKEKMINVIKSLGGKFGERGVKDVKEVGKFD